MYNLGIDLGGTNIAAGVVDGDYNIVSTATVKTNLPRKAEDIVNDMVNVAFEAIKNANLTLSDIDAFGIGTPGSVNPNTGVVSFSNNLQFYDLPICEMLKEKTGKTFFIENDANAAAYGEYIAGAGKGTKNFIAITLGTGVGGGIIIDGKLYSGSNFAGAELGHTVIQMNGQACTCGRLGCFEAYASATALIRQTKQAMIRYPDSLMWKLCENDINKVNGRTSFDAMRLGDDAGKRVVDDYIGYLSIGISNIINVFQPEIICIGGGVSKEGETLTNPLKKIVCGENYARNIGNCTEIIPAKLGNDAGIIGAAFLCNFHK